MESDLESAVLHNSDTEQNVSERSPLLPAMVSEKVSISQQVLVSQSNLSTKKAPQYIAAIIATIGGLIAGTCLAWTSPTAKALEKGDPDYGFKASTDDMGWIGSAMPIGAIIGSLITAVLVDKLGRKNLILWMVVPSIAGWLVMVFAQSVLIMCLGRFLTGIPTGAFCIVVPMYTGELSEKDIRGTLGTYFQLQITAGILLVYVIGSFVQVKTLTIICAALPVIFAILMCFLPETPYFYALKKEEEEAKKSIAWFRGNEQSVEPELRDLQRQVEEVEAEKVPFLESFQTKAAKRGLLVGLGIMFLQQFSGCNAVIFYTASIFEDVGATLSANASSIIVGVVQVLATYVSTFLVDRLGRRFLLLLSIVVMAICTFVLGVYFFLKQDMKLNVAAIAFLPLISVCGYIIVFSLGFGPIPWMLMGEIFAPKIKGAASSLAGLTNWICVFIITKTFPLAQGAFGTGITFWVFTVFSGLGIAFVALLVPETRNKTLVEIQEMLGGADTTQNAVTSSGLEEAKSKV